LDINLNISISLNIYKVRTNTDTVWYILARTLERIWVDAVDASAVYGVAATL
jgi:hypothetical protein